MSRSTPKPVPRGSVPGSVDKAENSLCMGHLQHIESDGLLRVLVPGAGELSVAWLENASQLQVRLQPGDTLLIARLGQGGVPVAMGRIGRYEAQPDSLTLNGTRQLSLQCGESSIDLRADGKVMIRGDDVLVRAKGTKRIRAGTVSIN